MRNKIELIENDTKKFEVGDIVHHCTDPRTIRIVLAIDGEQLEMLDKRGQKQYNKAERYILAPVGTRIEICGGVWVQKSRLEKILEITMKDAHKIDAAINEMLDDPEYHESAIPRSMLAELKEEIRKKDALEMLIELHKKRSKRDREFKVGDVILCKGLNEIGLVTYSKDDFICVMWDDGSCGKESYDDLTLAPKGTVFECKSLNIRVVQR